MNNTLETLQHISQKIKKNIVWIFLFSLIVAIITFFIVRTIKPTYSTFCKIFPLSINKSGGSSPLDAIKSQFGISDKTDYDKIYNVTELVTSKTISANIVSSGTQNKKYKQLADWILYDYNSNLPIWKKKLKWNDKDSNEKIIIAAGLFLAGTTITTDVKSGFTKIVTKFHDKKLAKEAGECILESLSSYYILLATEKPRSDLVKIRIMRDSLKQELYAVERAIAGFQDSNQLSVKYSVNIPQAKLLRTRTEIEQLYAVTVSAYQNARFKLLSESPIFQILDAPGEPYLFEKTSATKLALISFVLAFIFSILIAIRKVFYQLILREIMGD